MNVSINPRINTNPKFGNTLEVVGRLSTKTRNELELRALKPNSATIKDIGGQTRITYPNSLENVLILWLQALKIPVARVEVPKA